MYEDRPRPTRNQLHAGNIATTAAQTPRTLEMAAPPGLYGLQANRTVCVALLLRASVCSRTELV